VTRRAAVEALQERTWLLCAGVALLGLLVGHARADADRPGPWVFVYGLQGAGAAETARSLGCNTLYFDLPEDTPVRLDEARALIREATAQGLQVIVGLRTKLAGDYRISARDPAYVAAVGEWIRAVVAGLRDTPGVAAWATDHYLERDISLTEKDFRAFLLERYGSVEALNAAWGTQYSSIEAVTRARAREVDDDQVHGVGRPSVDLAEFERRAFHDVMAMWAAQVRSADPDTPLMTGRISLYRSLTAIPEAYDIVQVYFPPDILEPDTLTHNVHGVEIARRGGRFEVIPWLRVPLPPSEAYSQMALTRWILEAGLRGAVGVCLDDYECMSTQQAVLNNTVYQLSAALGQAPFADNAPKPCAAVIYEPYAGGHLFAGTPGYGYIEDYRENDFAELAFNYRLGTVLGGLDYLLPEDLRDTDLSRYSAIFAPACLSLPPEVVGTLRDWVEAGGALFADLGAGMYQAGSWVPQLGPLAPLMGLTGAIEPADRFGDFRVGVTHPALPSVALGMESHGTFVPGRTQSLSMGHFSRYSYEGPASAMKGYAFQGPSWFVSVGGDTVPLATQSVRYDEQRRPHFLGLTVATVGQGLALFAPFACWSHWPPQDALHAAVHGDLMARRARYRLVSEALVDLGIGLASSRDAVHLLSRSGASAARVLAGAADHRVYLGATCTFSATARTADGRRSGTVLLDIELTPGGMAHCEAVPVRIRPESGKAHARVSVYSPGLIALDVGGDGAQWGRARRDGPVGFYGGLPTRVRVTVDDDLYAVAAGSRHLVTLTEGREQAQTMTVTADHRGRLDFWLTVTGGRVTITPAQDEATGRTGASPRRTASRAKISGAARAS